MWWFVCFYTKLLIRFIFFFLVYSMNNHIITIMNAGLYILFSSLLVVGWLVAIRFRGMSLITFWDIKSPSMLLCGEKNREHARKNMSDASRRQQFLSNTSGLMLMHLLLQSGLKLDMWIGLGLGDKRPIYWATDAPISVFNHGNSLSDTNYILGLVIYKETASCWTPTS